ncbi:MAG: hypothetical protein ISS82_04875 [Nanoarchaeota archaeon]|nr:hypothetical protein [Nanoarchaeota archaeon]
MINKKFILLLFILFILPVFVNSEDIICSVYITGVGCPNCAITDTFLLNEITSEYPNLVVIEYEIYHLRSSNQDVANEYFNSYIPFGGAGVPFLIFNNEEKALGRFQVLDSEEVINSLDSNACPLMDGSSVSFEDLELTSLPGKVNIWMRDRVLISGDVGNNELLKEVLFKDDLIDFESIDPVPVFISGSEIYFEDAIKVDDWILQWNKKLVISNGVEEVKDLGWNSWYFVLIGFFIILILFLIYRIGLQKKVCFTLNDKQKNYLIVLIAVLFLFGFFILAKNISPEFLEKIGYGLPLPVFTFFIALIDGFNPCNLFVLTFLLGLLISASHSRKKIYIIGFSFIFVVFIVYLLFMAAWLNIFKYIGFITPLRVVIASIALIAGIINCKELLFFRKGITLMIQDKHKAPLVRKIEKMKDIIKNGSYPLLISSSIVLAAFASLVELPCTAGFPIIYTGILSGKVLSSSLSYYFYLLLYNLIYVLPLAVVILIFGFTFKGKEISKRQMQIIKFIGGLIMILLGIILLFNPGLIGI